jgi:hypothetical protein
MQLKTNLQKPIKEPNPQYIFYTRVVDLSLHFLSPCTRIHKVRIQCGSGYTTLFLYLDKRLTCILLSLEDLVCFLLSFTTRPPRATSLKKRVLANDFYLLPVTMIIVPVILYSDKYQYPLKKGGIIAQVYRYTRGSGFFNFYQLNLDWQINSKTKGERAFFFNSARKWTFRAQKREKVT